MPNFSLPLQLEGDRIHRIAAFLQKYIDQYGYKLIETPIAESTDVVAYPTENQPHHPFIFEQDEANFALRTDFTSAAVRWYIKQKRQDVARWQFSGPVFRVDAKNHYQCYSAGVELFGMSDPAAEAEIISLAALGLNALGVNHWSLRIGHAGLTQQLFSHFELESSIRSFIWQHRRQLREISIGKEWLRQQLGLYVLSERYVEESGGESLSDVEAQLFWDVIMGKLTAEQLAAAQISRYLHAERIMRSIQWDSINAALDFLGEWLLIHDAPPIALSAIEKHVGDDEIAWQMVIDWRAVLTLMDAYGVPPEHILIQTDATGFEDYYTGLVFELCSPDGQRLAKGGRYNDFARFLGYAQTLPLVGFAYDLELIERVLPPGAHKTPSPIHLITGRHTDVAAARWATALRQRGIAAEVVNPAQARGENPLFVREDGRVQLGQQFYSPEQIDLLVITLNGLP